MGRAVRGDFLEEVTRSSASGTGLRQAAWRHAARGNEREATGTEADRSAGWGGPSPEGKGLCGTPVGHI